MKRDVGDILRTLIRNQEETETGKPASGVPDELPTLGATLVKKDDRHYVIDLSSIRTFRHLHTFVELLADEVIEQCAFGAADIMVRRRVDPHLTPELAATGLDWIMIYVRLDAAEGLPFDHRNFSSCMQEIFRTLQTEKWGGLLFPDFFGLADGQAAPTPPALLFPFHLHAPEDKGAYYYLVEYSRPGRFLRITIEDAVRSRLQLKHIAHRVVDQPVRRSYLPDIYPTAEKIHLGILREAVNHRSEHVETPSHLPDFFFYLQQAGLPHLQQIHFAWPTDDRQMIFLENIQSPDGQAQSLTMLLKEIQLLEDPAVLRILAQGCLVEMISGLFSIYFDVSRWGACLHVSFDEFRHAPALEDYLTPMKALSAAAARHAGALAETRLFVIHHMTAEVLGLLKAFTDAECETLTTFFVQYAGIVPDAYLETLMSLPPDQFRFYGLQKVESRSKLGGLYTLSQHLTPLSGLEAVNQVLADEEPDFLDAMRLAAGHLFFKEVQRARNDTRRLLLVEDGGYLAPLVNRFCLEGKSLAEVLAAFCLPCPEAEKNLSFADWLTPVFWGSVEHTKNGYDYNQDVWETFGKLQFPAASIAVSHLKRGPEAEACAASILNAAENILHRLGLLLSRRKLVILGSAGAIGGFLKKELTHRLKSRHLFGVDIAADIRDITQARTLDELGEDVLVDTDMFIGVVGHSIFQARHAQTILLRGRHQDIFFASGSTKTVEFSELLGYLQTLRDAADPQINGCKVCVDFSPLRDLQTGALQGYSTQITFPENPAQNKTLYLLGELMPVNFLYYGIPREIVDEVMAQLFALSCGLVRRQQSADKLPLALLAVDRNIDENADPLSSGT